MNRAALVLVAMLLSSSAYAETIVIGCPLLSKYSDADVNNLLGQARSVLSEQEVGHIYHRYVSLKTACQTNANASRSVAVSGALRTWLAQRGIDVASLGRL
jgi:hypothetical protein